MMADQVSRQIAATPEKVWALVADAPRMAEWSPVLVGCEWIGGASGPEVGARFVGHNRQSGMRWSRECVVIACDPGREFAFQTFFKGAPSTHWRYLFEPSGDGTKVTESYEIVSMPRYVRAVRKIPGMIEKGANDTRAGMALTLERIAAIAER